MMQKSHDELVNDITDRIKQIRSYTPKVGVFGNSGVGKSSLCNALFGKEIAKISDVQACTRAPQEILLGATDGQGGITLVDVPGIGEDPSRQTEYTALYKSLVPNLDLVLWVIKADDRNYASALDAYHAVFSTDNKTPVVFAISQTDKTNDADDWNREEYVPGMSQIANIKVKEHDVSNRFNVSTRKIASVATSKKGKSYNLVELVDLIVKELPKEKKFSVTRELKEENVSFATRAEAEKGIWDSVREMAGNAWDSVKDEVMDVVIKTAPIILALGKDWVMKNWKSWLKIGISK